MSKNKKKLGYIVIRWFAMFGDLVDSIFGIATFGFYYPRLGLHIRRLWIKMKVGMWELLED